MTSKKKSRSLFQRLLQIFVYLFFGFVGIVLLITGYFYLERDNIGRKVLLLTNNLAHGELTLYGQDLYGSANGPEISKIKHPESKKLR